MTSSRRLKPRQPHGNSHRWSVEPAAVVPLKSEQLYDAEESTALVFQRTPAQRYTMRFWAAAIAIVVCAIAYFWVVENNDRMDAPGQVTEPATSQEFSINDEIVAFTEWMRAKGGRVSDKISIAGFEGMGRGIVARAPVEENEELLFVPLELIICRETIWKRAPKKLLVKYEKLRDSPTELVTAFLLLEQFKDSGSLWFPYLRILPDYPTTFERIASPLFYESSEEVSELQDVRAILAANLERRQAKIAFQRFRRLFKNVLPADSKILSLLEKRYLWARFLVNSRAFSVRGDRYLVPFGDVFNGKPQPKNERKLSDGNGAHFLKYHRLQDGVGMEILADRAVTDAGLQMFEDYGDNDNYVYFLYHGFIMEDNPFDCASVQLPALTANSMAKRVVDDFAYGSNEPRTVCITREGAVRSPQDKQTVQLYASIMTMDDEYMDVLCSKRENYPLCISHSTDFEQQKFLIQSIRQQLDAFATTEEEDLVLLTAETTPLKLRHAIKFRISRKQLLKSALSKLETSIKLRDARQPEDMLGEASSQESSVDERMGRFSRWVGQMNFPINHVELKYVGPTMGYGTFATKPLEKGEVYLSVPTDVVMDASSAVRSPFIRGLLVQGRQASVRWTESHILLLHLLHEKFASDHKSRWRPYLDILPDQGRLASPLFYHPEGRELELLDAAVPHDLSRLMHEYRRRVGADFEFMKQNVQNLPDWVTIERFRWANAILDSRSIWWSSTRHLVPLLDMVNCMEISRDHEPHATRVGSGGDAAVTHASWRFGPGDQVVENYAQPNYIYLLYHGFVLSDNSHDCAHFHFELDLARQMTPQDTDRKAVIALMEKMHLYSWSQDVCVGGQKPGGDLQKLLRVALIAQSPRKAARAARESNGEVTREHVEAASHQTTERLGRLERAINAHESHESGSERSILLYIHQQHQLMTQVLKHLHEYPHLLHSKKKDTTTQT